MQARKNGEIICGKPFEIGRKVSKEIIDKVVKTKSKNPTRYWLGKKRSLRDRERMKNGWTMELRKKLSENKRGKKIHWEVWNKGKKLSEEIRRKLSEAMKGRFKGKKSPHWKGELCKKQDKRNDSLYQNWVVRVKKRDKECMLKNNNCSGYKIVHHILSWSQYPKERYNISNGITLCQYHHPRKRVDEQRLIPTFQKLIGSNK